MLGLGYVGLPLLGEFTKARLDAVGFDVDCAEVDAIKRGESYIADVPDEEVRAVTAAGRLRATADFGAPPMWTRSTSAFRHRCATQRIP